MVQTRRIDIVTSDAGGTMTDVLVVDDQGRFSVGKASTTPHDESVGYWESFKDACSYWGLDAEKTADSLVPSMQAAIYTGTTMLNALLTRTGRRVGVIVTEGFQDMLEMGRGFELTAGLGGAELYHSVSRYKLPPMVPKKLMRGITERIDFMGREVIPLYENEVRQEVRRLVDSGVEAICFLFLFSFVNPSHEQRAAQIAREVMGEMKREVEILLSSDICPVIREMNRLNSVVVQAYAAAPAREQLFRVEDKLKDKGYRHHLQTLLSFGGLADIRHQRLYEAMVSGPVGGLIGAKYVADVIGEKNVISCDLGGTSFDVGMVREGVIPIEREPAFARSIFNLPMVMIDSIGAGAGQYVRVEHLTGKLTIGPDSAGAVPGPVCYGQGNLTPTIIDCNLALGILDPDYYLGGKVKLDKELALQMMKEKVAGPLKLDVYQAAEGIVRLLNARLVDALRAMVLCRGFHFSDYVLMVFGGAGPMHMAGFCEGLGFKGVMTMPFAAGFSAFGCAAADYMHRYHRTGGPLIHGGASDAEKMEAGHLLNRLWEGLEKEAVSIAKGEGFDEKDIQLQPFVFMRYYGQFDDLEVPSPTSKIESPEDLNRLIAQFEDLFGRIYSLAARTPEAGFHVSEVGVICTVPKIKPRLEARPLGSKEPGKEASKGKRRVYWEGRWQEAALYEMDLLKPGNEIEGIAVVEAPATTLFVPPRKKIKVDKWGFMWM